MPDGTDNRKQPLAKPFKLTDQHTSGLHCTERIIENITNATDKDVLRCVDNILRTILRLKLTGNRTACVIRQSTNEGFGPEEHIEPLRRRYGQNRMLGENRALTCAIF